MLDTDENEREHKPLRTALHRAGEPMGMVFENRRRQLKVYRNVYIIRFDCLVIRASYALCVELLQCLFGTHTMWDWVILPHGFYIIPRRPSKAS